MEAPQILLIVIMAAGFGATLPKAFKDDCPLFPIAAGITIFLLSYLLYWGGFWQ